MVAVKNTAPAVTGACTSTACASIKNVFKPIFFEKTVIGSIRDHGIKGSWKWIKETDNVSVLAGAILFGLACFTLIKLVKATYRNRPSLCASAGTNNGSGGKREIPDSKRTGT